MTGMGLDQRSQVPLYHQLAEILRRQIAKERWPAGRKLPSEHELCRAYGVTRPTVRQALDGLLREGLVSKRRGLGTFVAEPKPRVGLFSLSGTTEAFGRQRLKLNTLVLSVELVEGCPLAGAHAPTGPHVRLERLRSVHGRPALFERTWIRAGAVRGLEDLNLNDKSLYETLHLRYGLEVEGGVQRFSAVPADASVAQALGVKRNTPIMRVTRCLNLTGQPAAMHVELFAAEGPFVLEERIPSGAGKGEFAPQMAAVWGRQ